MAIALKTVESYWRADFRAAGVPFHPIRRVFAYTAASAKKFSCGGVPLVPNNALYRPAGDFVAYDGPWAKSQYKSLGNAFIFVLIGHEYGHRIQRLLNQSSPAHITIEPGADCFSGAYLGDSVRARVLELEPGDIDTLEAGFNLFGDPPGVPWFAPGVPWFAPGVPWFAPGAHGTPQQRMTLFNDGFENGLAGC